MKRKVAAVIACILTAGLLYAGYQVWQQGSEYLRASNAYSQLDAYVQTQSTLRPTAAARQSTAALQGEVRESASPVCTAVPAADIPTAASQSVGAGEPIQTLEPPAAVEKEYDYPDVVWPEVDFEQLKQINPEIVGWIYDEGMGLNYPVVQAQDNTKYLTTLFDGRRNKTGCLFLDAGNAADFSDRHSIIYGHNRKNGSMFGRLSRYKKQRYYEEHPRILLITEQGRYVLEIFSGHVARSNSGAWKIRFADETEFAQWRSIICERSSIKTGVRPEEGERILTLSTCSYEFAQARYVVHGVLRKARMPEH